MKGVSLQITFIVLLALAVAVMTFSIIYFRTQTGSLNEMNDKRYLMTCCQKWIADECSETDVTPTQSNIVGCSNFIEVAKRNGFVKDDGSFDREKLKDYCGCPQGD